MAAIESLLKVMTLRDAEAMILEPNKIPSLRRRGQIEALALPALDAKMLEDFASPLVAGRTELPAMVPFTDVEGASFTITIDRVAAGYKLNVRRGKPAPLKPSAPPRRAEPTVRAPDKGGDAIGDDDDDAGATGAMHAQRRGGDEAGDHRRDTGRDHGFEAHRREAIAAGEHRREAIARLAELLAAPVALAHGRGASDVTLSTGQPTRIRVDGRLEPIDHPVDDAELAGCVTGLRERDTGISADLSLDVAGVRVRVNAFDHLNGYGVAARLIRDHVPGLAELGLPAELAGIVDQRDGLVLVCGPTGSGKSTTLASLVDLLDQRRAAHIITLEDPIEYRFAARRCLIHQRELGTHIPTFADGLRAALREAPDVILLGELRDRDTLAAALTAAETGHLVLATLHAPNAAGAIDRMIDAFPDGQQRQVRWQLAGVLRTVVSQFLLPRKDGGRIAAIELVPVTTAVANIIRKGDLHTLPTAIQSGREAGMIPLERTLAKLVDSGIVSAQAVKRIAADHDLLAALANKLR